MRMTKMTTKNEKVGIFGGSFNPPHMGHLNSLQTVMKKAGLGKIHVIPAYQNPLKPQTEGPTPEQRLEMTKLAVESWGPQYVVDDQEIKKSGVSYTIETIENLRKQVDAENLFLIIGIDTFHHFDKWKDVKEILSESNLIVTSRSGFDLPQSSDELPAKVKKLVADFDFNFVELKTGRNIQFIHLQDIDISATELRKRLRTGKNVEKFIPLSVENYIKNNKLYQNLGQRIGDYQKFTEFCANVLFSKKGILVVGYDLRKLSAPSEFTLVCSGTSTKHTSSLADNLAQAVKEEFNVLPQSIEGLSEGRWVVIDYGALIVHIFYDFVRNEYALEKLWKDAVNLQLKEKS
jgi:nicotinate-nucleotide adenylyltransferase